MQLWTSEAVHRWKTQERGRTVSLKVTHCRRSRKRDNNSVGEWSSPVNNGERYGEKQKSQIKKLMCLVMKENKKRSMYMSDGYSILYMDYFRINELVSFFNKFIKFNITYKYICVCARARV